MGEPARDEARGLQALTELAERAGEGSVAPSVHARGRAKLLDALQAERVPVTPIFGGALKWLALVPVAAGATALLLWLRAPLPEAAIDVVAEGPATLQDGYARANGAGAALRFSEGTRIELGSEARARISDRTANGARVSLEAGRASFHVVHRDHTSWRAEAGPYTVEVTGTAFDLGWAGDKLDVNLREGSVIVRGPSIAGGVPLAAGQHLTAEHGQVTIKAEPVSSFLSGAPSSVETATPAIVVTSAPVTSSSASAPIASASMKSERSWRARVAAGDFAGVIADAEARGLDASIDGTSLSDLAALADAARYGGRGDLSRRALQAERKRFSGSAEASSAAFLLGRMDEASSPASAVAWYDRYLAEAPGGALAAEALGRRMVAIKAASGKDAARAAADDYLRRYPEGAFAAQAHEIIGAP
jgi:hypothetical protein